MTSVGRFSPANGLQPDDRLGPGELAIPINVLAAFVRAVGGVLVLTEHDLLEYTQEGEYLETSWSEETQALTVRLHKIEKLSECEHPPIQQFQVIHRDPYMVEIRCQQCNTKLDQLTGSEIVNLPYKELTRRGFRL